MYKYSKDEKDKKFLDKFSQASFPVGSYDIESGSMKFNTYSSAKKEFETKTWNRMNDLIIKHRKFLQIESLIKNKPSIDTLVETWLSNYKSHLAYTIWISNRI